MEWDVLRFADYMSADLVEIEVTKRSSHVSTHDPTQTLKRIRDEHGSLNAPLTETQKKRNLFTGNCITANCYVCKKYEPRGKYNKTAWECSGCGTYLCRSDRTGKLGRERSCLQEHLYSSETCLRCRNDGEAMTSFPKNKRYKES